MTIEDLRAHEVELDSPVTGRFRDLDVSVPPPNSQGFVLLQILAGIEHLGIDPDPLVPDAAMLAHLFRVTGSDRDRHNADPRHARVPVGTLVDEGHVAALCDAARDLSMGEAAPGRTGDTAAVVAADGSGLAVSVVQSLYDGFGSGVLEPETGVVLHNRGSRFVLDPSHPNAIAGGKRPAHTLMPVVVHRAGRLAAVSGTMGGAAHPQINAITLIRSLALGLGAAEAIAAPRWLVGGLSGEVPAAVVAESRVPAALRGALRAAGYAVEIQDPFSASVGHANLIRIEADGTLDAGADPRADGAAAAR
jgi:gamma-glutamyltranspeptidase/glutathione hydrolase